MRILDGAEVNTEGVLRGGLASEHIGLPTQTHPAPGYPPGVAATGFGCTTTYRKADRDDRRGLGFARASSGAERFSASATETSAVLETMMLRSSRGSTAASWSLWWSVDQRRLGAERTLRGAHDYCHQYPACRQQGCSDQGTSVGAGHEGVVCLR